MRAPTDTALEERILLSCPTGRDAAVTLDVLTRAGVRAEVCRDLLEVCTKLVEGAGVGDRRN